ncbi:MAG: DUF4150 domain-containing protein [Deltaproteobacteria bacterium]|nr:DUF4150 domain-containing protein [Deltaproteobacteria bacterium]
MFANCQKGGMSLGFPDVCLTPSPAGPVPIPYPNTAQQNMGAPAVIKVLYDGAPAHNLNTKIAQTTGDNAGVSGGVASGTVMGPAQHVTGSFTVLSGGMPATKMTSVSIQNSTNCPGVALVPSQVKVLLLAP